ncbi:hypothetical protein Vretimale_2789 [Volvox reticuliferus]|uniref:Farnesoic acid O-methyl transferase domain-containing protein n=1 Tax=Volvox reticuliferus TaxID=1737510 RepID=A0A8J4DDA8_9CHLO|nr:hypothetical protein Vretimale_2789 [Volvox reticuliferus]
MLRVNNGVLVVPPFECAWLTGEGYILRSGSGCLSFEAKGDTDVTVILKSTPGAKRLQPLLRQGGTSGGNALQVEQNYTIIFGSHRNSCLKIEKNGVTQCMVTGVACSRVSSKAFSKYWIDLNHGILTVGHGEPGHGVCQQWHDPQEIPGIQHIGLSCWDRHVSYRSIALQPHLDFNRLQQLGGGTTTAVPSLFDTTCAAIMAATTPTNVCHTLHVAELLLPTTQKLYRYCLDFIARHLETVVRLPDPDQHLRCVSPAAMCDLVCQNTFSVDEQGIFAAVHDWACSLIATSAVARAGSTEGYVAKCRDGDGHSGTAGERSCIRRLASPHGGSPGPPSSPTALAGPRPRLSDPSSASAASAASTVSTEPFLSGTGGITEGRGDCPPKCTHVGNPLAIPNLPSAPGMPVRSSLRVQAVADAGVNGSFKVSSGGESTGILSLADEAACRVLSLIRFPLLPIDQLHSCLQDPLLRRLPVVLGLVNEALEVHRRETGGDQTAGGQDARQDAQILSPSSGRRLVKPLPATTVASSAAVAGPVGLDLANGGVISPTAGGGGASTVGPAGSGGAAAAASAAGDSCWSVRYQRRCLPFALELMYVCDGDSSGVLHFLGTSYGAQGWVNPMLAKRVDVRASSPTGRTTDPRVVVGRQFVRTNFAGPRYVNGAAISWWQVDLGEQHQLAITYYTLRHDGSQDFVRSWVLQVGLGRDLRNLGLSLNLGPCAPFAGPNYRGAGCAASKMVNAFLQLYAMYNCGSPTIIVSASRQRS